MVGYNPSPHGPCKSPVSGRVPRFRATMTHGRSRRSPMTHRRTWRRSATTDLSVAIKNLRTWTRCSHRIQAGARSCATSSPTASGRTTSTSSLRKPGGWRDGYLCHILYKHTVFCEPTPCTPLSPIQKQSIRVYGEPANWRARACAASTRAIRS